MKRKSKSKPQNFELPLKEYLALQRRREPEEKRLLKTAKRRLPKLKALLAEVSGHWGYEDGIYRFYHHSFKVFSRLRPATLEIVKELQALAPHLKLNNDFMQIISEGTGFGLDPVQHPEPPKDDRKLVEAFFHARYMLEMACKYAEVLPEPPQVLPSGYATVLYLFNLR